MSENTPASTAHEPDCDVQFPDGTCPSWCYGCMRCEPMREGDYRICGECFHVFRTADDLVSADLVAHGLRTSTNRLARPADEINVCPVCAHDF